MINNASTIVQTALEKDFKLEVKNIKEFLFINIKSLPVFIFLNESYIQ